ncbi:Tekt4p [Sparganum proliferum]
MYCSDTQTLVQRTAPKEAVPCFPEQVYAANDGVETGISTIGFRSGRYAPSEAQESIDRRYMQSHLDNEISKQTREDSKDLMRETNALTEADFKTTTDRLKERLTDLHFWKSELEREILDMITTIDHLVQCKVRVEKALLAIDEAILICTDNLNARQRRFGEDLQQDAVELSLIKGVIFLLVEYPKSTIAASEVHIKISKQSVISFFLQELDVLNKSAALYKRTIEQLNNQIKRDRDVKQDLEMAWSDKHEADLLDTEGGHLKPTSTNKQHYPGEARAYPQAAQSTVESWTQHPHDIILRAEHERMASEQLLHLASNIINDVTRDVIHQKDVVNAAFQKRLDEYEADKFRLTGQLKATCDEIAAMEKNIKELELAIAAKDAYVQTVQTRLHLHNKRPNVENCRDPPQKAMLDELTDIQNSIDRLRDKLNLSENNLKHLQDTQLMLEKEIHMKNNSIQVDKDHCVRHRMSFPDAVRLQGH